jgi:small subunit ribosomal protein S20
MVRSATRTTVKKAEAVIAAGDPEAAREAVRAALAYVDRAAKKGVIHANAAARRKSRLVLKYNAAVAAVQAPAAEADAPKRRRAPAKPAKPAASSRAKKSKK